MALVDAGLCFIPLNGAPLSLVGAAGASFSTQWLDLMGVGVGLAPPNIIGTAALWGADYGVGNEVLELVCRIGTGLATADGCTLNAQWQFAPDTGSAGGYQPGTVYTVVETGAIAVANLTANTHFFAVKFPQIFPGNIRPRFHRLNFVTPAGELLTAGTISQAFLTDTPQAYSIANTPNNYVVH